MNDDQFLYVVKFVMNIEKDLHLGNFNPKMARQETEQGEFELKERQEPRVPIKLNLMNINTESKEIEMSHLDIIASPRGHADHVLASARVLSNNFTTITSARPATSRTNFNSSRPNLRTSIR